MSTTEQRQDQTGANWLAVLIAAADWIVRNSDAIGLTWAEMTNGVTNVKKWVNQTDDDVEVWKLDGGSQRKDNYRVAPGQTLHADMWIPWADNPTGYTDHHATILVGGRPLAYLWQSGAAVRFNGTDMFVAGGNGVPGAAGAGGNRTMVIGKDPRGNVGFALSVL